MERLNFKRVKTIVSSFFSVIIQISLTYDKYTVLWSDNTVVEINKEGSFVDLLKEVIQSIHPEDIKILLEYYHIGHLLTFLEEKQISEVFEVRYYGSDDKYHWVEVNIIQDKGKIDGENDILIFAKNIEFQKEREEALKSKLKTIKNEVQNRTGLISRISHDIRTPMNVIIGMADIARKSEENPDKMKACLDKILTASDYVMTLINTVLDAAKIDYNIEGRLNDEFTLEQLIEDVKNIVLPQIETKSIDFQVSVGALTSRKFIGDRILLNRVLINLISNSTKFVAEGGQIILFVEELGVENEQMELSFTVEDNGIGISEEFLGKVFQPFEQDKSGLDSSCGGSGLGLSICRVLVEKIGGKISVQSEKEKGSQFNVVVPLRIQRNNECAETIVQSLEIKSIKEHDYQGKRILIVEDNELNIEIVLAILEEKNLKIEIARNGQEAIDLFKKTSEKYFDMILMDIMMPVKNGIEATLEIRDLERNDSKTIPIIAMTADGYNNDISKILEDKLNDSVLKPIDTDQLFSTLHFWLKTT